MKSAEGPQPTRRQWVIDTLCEAFARDRIEIHELERRLEVANRVHTEAELRSLLDGIDLSSASSGVPGESGQGTASGWPTPPDSGAGGALPSPPPNQQGTVPASQVPDRQFTVAFWSGRVRKGSWIPARTVSAIAIMGGVELDFREALLGPGVTSIQAVAVMGAVEITVPPGVHVDTSGFAVMGAFEDDVDGSGPPRSGGPTLRVSGFACMGAVEVRVRLPGESERDARRRKKLERQVRGRAASGRGDSGRGD